MRALMFGVLAAAGCRSVTVEVVQMPCVDVDLVDPGPPELVVTEDGADMLLVLSAAFAPSDAIFQPDIEIPKAGLGAQEIFITEGWSEGTGPELCWFPGILVYDPPPGKYEIEWYEPGDVVPLVRQTYDW
jgi:hypothetical protein